MLRRFCLALGLLLFLGGSGDLFAQIPTDTSRAGTPRSFDTPINPDRYLIRPGERLEVVFVGAKLPTLRLVVNAEGLVVHADLGVVELAGKTLTAARAILLEPLTRLFNAEDIVISVTSVYPVSIQVTGLVRRPGAYVGYTSQRVSELIDSAGGIVRGGSTRLVRIVGGAEGLTADLALARATGDLSLDPCLYAGTRIIVPALTDAPVIVTGAVLHPGAVELLPGEDLARAVALAGGLKAEARLTGSLLNDPARDISAPGAIRPGDKIRVSSAVVPIGAGEVIVTGAAMTVGREIPLDPGRLSLGEFISDIGGLSAGANRDRIAVFRLAWDPVLETQTSERYPIWIGGANSTSVRLQHLDSIHVPRLLTHVEVSGLVQHPGLYPYSAGQTIDDYMTMAGGFTGDGGELQIELYDRVSGLTRTASERTVVSDGDRIIVKQVELDR